MPALIAWFVAGLSRLFASRLGMWITSALVFLGLELGTQTVVVQPILAQIQATASGLPADAAGWMAFFNIDRYITILLSAYAAGGVKTVLRRRSAS